MARRPFLAASLLAFAVAVPAAAQAPARRNLDLSYDGVLVIKVLDMRLQQRLEPEQFEASAQLKSYGVLAIFKRIDVNAEAHGRLADGDPRPALFHHVNRDG